MSIAQSHNQPRPPSGKPPSARPARDALPARALRWAYWRALVLYRTIFQNRSHIFQFDPHATAPKPVPGLVVHRFASVESISDEMRRKLIACFGEKNLRADEQELRSRGVLWIGTIEDNLVATWFTRRGRDFRRWFVPLADDDIVLFRIRTVPSHRGRGIASAGTALIFDRELEAAGKAFVDCLVHNTSSIRSILKSGFRLILTTKPIDRDEMVPTTSR